MSHTGDRENFTFNWLAMKLLGRGLYSNPWSALSELVANGLDAEASRVWVFMDIREKSAATIEIFDNGSGMDRGDIRTYAKVGHNKRDVEPNSKRAAQLMGRKGIGKLAALYLSRHFFLRTRRGLSDTTWLLDARDGNIRDEDQPMLIATESMEQNRNLKKWEAEASGTFLRLHDVDLRGYGDEALGALGARLANQFLLPNSRKAQVLLAVREEGDKTWRFQSVKKKVAFRNLAFISHNIAGAQALPKDLERDGRPVVLPAKDLPDGRYSHQVKVARVVPAPSFPDPAMERLKGRVDFEKSTFDGHPFALTGWIGIHATIESDEAQQNDKRFRKNKFYNPAQIRVYVRGKLANDRLLDQLGLTGTYRNYVEGEISFDLLDVNDLDDIATSNRQDFDETDDRVALLRSLVRPIVRGLIQKRMALAAEITRLGGEEKRRRETVGKTIFVNQLAKDLERYEDLSVESKTEIQTLTANKLRGDVTTKSRFKVFLSHASADRRFSDMVYRLLLARGVSESEIFYTSKVGDASKYEDTRALGLVVRDSILESNTLVFYVTSENFLESQFCMFEGGAGWATRAVGEYLKLNVAYDAVPKFLSNDRLELPLKTANGIQLTADIHNYLIDCVLNPIISHLNQGREINGENSIDSFSSVEFPSPVSLQRSGETIADYFDVTISDHWEAHVVPGLDAYVVAYDKLVGAKRARAGGD